ncbi:helix-turn-helix domain-containing protein [Nocardiopsis suaedae]|uniref:Helix-turn-helix transcriptional regulator n=1 Tax=Nocardiopsis suaedae TaxID=3018444 RepID=A0ABT4TJ21_9ACTN|nr:helix-turn-helix transcriptional regulator [Nocardiopsis suaedae]MDA2804366.1 helix-turn-helix transcriptional regulator [Nocardiopsis suaedae]
MPTISRRRRAELARAAAQIRIEGQRSGRTVHAVAAEIVRRLPQMRPLEAHRHAYGWTRRQLADAVVEAIRARGQADPGLSEARICRWEHNGVHPSADYAEALIEVFAVPPARLGLTAPRTAWYGRGHPRAQGVTMADHAPLTAVTDSIALHLEVEGPAGGPQAREQVGRALNYFAVHYGDHAPTLMATEVHRCRGLVVGMLAHRQPDRDRRELRTLAGWLSALLGDFVFSASDYEGALIHLGTGARLGTEVGDARLASWSVGAQSMMTAFRGRDVDALELAVQASELADGPLQQAQMAAWCELRPLARMGRAREARDAARRAQRSMDAADEDPRNRWGFDRPELHQHLAEAHLTLGDSAQARSHAETARRLKRTGSGGWAAATAILARAAAADRDADGAVALADQILDTVPAESLRETTRRRLLTLDADLAADPAPGPAARALTDRLRALPAHSPIQRSSPEPNGR